MAAVLEDPFSKLGFYFGLAVLPSVLTLTTIKLKQCSGQMCSVLTCVCLSYERCTDFTCSLCNICYFSAITRMGIPSEV